ncbi:MAG TPA: MlaE family lipid ABC transporter permease subunit [Rhodocyclaceae bacterium]|nr:MlaE family lipid ABC transporter permease subunit [Rhodocyclaceae bacterium]
MAKLEISLAADGVRMVLGGRLDADGVAPVWPRARAALAGNPGLPVRVEAGEVDYCDGAGLAFLVDLLRMDRPAAARVEIVDLAERFRRLLDQFDPAAFRGPAREPSRPEGLFSRIGRVTAGFGADLKSQVAFVGEAGRALAYVLRHPRQLRWRDTLAVAEEAGVNALPIITLVAFLLGVIIAYQSAVAMRQFGAEVYVANLIGLSMVRELAPLMTAILLAGRSGAAFAAEIGTMRVNEEIDALTTFGFDPVRFLVVTRVLAALLVTPLLAIYADVVSIVGGALILLTFQIPLVTYFNQVFDLVAMNDLLGGLFKCLVFGVVISGIGCLRGLQTGSGAAAVGLSTTRAVVSALVLIVVVDGAFAIVYYHLGI